MNELIIVALALALSACVTWFATSRYYMNRLASIQAERDRERQAYDREKALLSQQVRHERRERRQRTRSGRR
jgi:hypothetical protein